MRKKVFETLLTYSSITLVFVLMFTYPVQAEISSEVGTDSLKKFPKILCKLLDISDCAYDNSIPDPNQPTPPYPSGGAPFPTANPQITPPSTKCMPPGGTIVCGSEFVPIRNCAHCSATQYPAGFRARFCTPNSGNAEAIDIAHKPLDSVPLPFINGHSILWTHTIDKYYSDGSDLYAAYQEYVGLDTLDKIQYRVRYIHTLKGSGVPLGQRTQSGSEGAKVCQKWVTYTNGKAEVAICNHVHIQIFNGLLNKWVPATDYYCH